MSSAALQSPHQTTALNSPPVAAASARQYTPSHISPNEDAYNARLPSESSTSASKRPPSRKRSDNGKIAPFDPNAVVTSHSVPTSAFAADNHAPSSPRYSNMPPVAPPRTSSNQQAASSRRGHYSNEKIANSPRRGHASNNERTSSHGDTNGATENGHRSKRSANPHLAPESPPRQTSSRDGRTQTTTLPIRTQPSPVSKSSRDASETLHRAIASSDDTNGRDATSAELDDGAAPPPVVAMSGSQEERRSGRSRHDHSRSHRGTSKFGDFILGNTIGEGEFGKVKLGWKQDSTVQVAIKLIKRDTVGSNPSRLAKIRREVTILRGIQHSNIVQLIDMVETDRYIGIILEYASGGELFDYILNHRYLRDNSARRLFSQLVSGVGYLHKKGIVHRDLKLENLLLDRNRNIIITDFGFANTFDPNEDLAEEEELNLTDREYVKRMGLDRVKPNGMRKGDLMQTSCGSPCYAAPELVVSDSLYTGRKVDVWSCGVILYAMLAGYLPFDDDPANPEGDNINLLYKYIVTTPLTFPEYVTPHARDLLRRILVPNPRKRADLFEVARHSWLGEYASLVAFITSSTTSPSEIQSAGITPEDLAEAPLIARSNSVREGPKQKSPPAAGVGGLTKTHGKIASPETDSSQRTPKDAKRRTVQVEYVAPTTQTQRGADIATSSTRARSGSRGPASRDASRQRDKPLPRDPPLSRDGQSRSGQLPPAPSSAPKTSAPTRPSRDMRAISDAGQLTSTSSGARPQTGNSMSSAASMRLQYGQPAPPAIADTNARGRIQQPSNTEDSEVMGRPSITVPPKFARVTGLDETPPREGRGHKRSNTIGDIGSKLLARNGSVFGGRKKRSEAQQPAEKSKKYPPVSMANAVPSDDQGGRQSMDSRASRRSFSLGTKKRSGSMSGSQESTEKPERRRFSLLPASFSLKAIGLGKEYGPPPSDNESRPFQESRSGQPRSFTAHGDARGSTPFFDTANEGQRQGTANSSPVYHQRFASAQLDNRRPNAIPPYLQQGAHLNTSSDSSVDMRRPPTEPQMGSRPREFGASEDYDGRRVGSAPRGNRVVLQKNHKRFTDAYDQQEHRGHEGSSGAAKRVMDFFRRRGKARGGEDR